MARVFDRNMFIMLLAILVGVVIITYFIGDIVRRSEIEELSIEHQTQIGDILSRNENFTDNFLQGSVLMDSARELREVGNYHFDFALFWYNNALVNTTDKLIQQCIGNCTSAMNNYLASHNKFDESKPYFETAKTFTERDRYRELLGYYVSFAESGKNITMLRYESSQYLKYAAENLSLGNMENVTSLMENFTQLEELYDNELDEYDGYKGQIDEYLFFDEIREN